MLKDTPERYGVVTKCLHWTIAFGTIGLIGLGWYMVGLSYYDRGYNSALTWHKSLGMIVLALALLFVVWKQFSRSPRLPASISSAQRLAATAAHHLLFLMMILIPITGYLISTSAGMPIAIFDWFEIPALIPVGERLRDLAIDIHFYCAYGTGVLAAGHAAAALKHQFVDRDGILARMLWR